MCLVVPFYFLLIGALNGKIYRNNHILLSLIIPITSVIDAPQLGSTPLGSGSTVVFHVAAR